MNDENPKLKKNILEEVLIEIRYSLDKDYNILFSSLYEKLKDYYKNFKNLKNPEFPSTPPNFPKFVNYQIRSDDGKKLYQIGDNIFAINNLNYEGFESFLEDIMKILKLHKKESNLESLDYILLRYINKVKVNRDINQIFTIGLNIPESIKQNEVGFNHLINCKYDDDYLKISFFSNPFSKDTVKLDFNYYKKEKFQYDLNLLKKWIKTAHNNIYKVFKASITEEYYNYLNR